MIDYIRTFVKQKKTVIDVQKEYIPNPTALKIKIKRKKDVPARIVLNDLPTEYPLMKKGKKEKKEKPKNEENIVLDSDNESS